MHEYINPSLIFLEEIQLPLVLHLYRLPYVRYAIFKENITMLTSALMQISYLFILFSIVLIVVSKY